MDKGIDEISLEGRRYISVKRAAALAKYTTDYVGQLCRAQKLEATRIGRNWYVEENSLIEHRQLNQENSRDKQEEQEKLGKIENTENRGELVKALRRNPNIFKGSFIIYSKDDSPLLPSLKEKKVETTNIPVIKGDENESVVPASIFTKANTGIEKYAQETINLWGVARKTFLFGSAIVVFMALFSLNGAYTGNLIGSSLKNMTGAVVATEFGKTVERDIFTPFELVAKEINSRIDDTVYSLLYEDILKRE